MCINQIAFLQCSEEQFLLDYLITKFKTRPNLTLKDEHFNEFKNFHQGGGGEKNIPLGLGSWRVARNGISLGSFIFEFNKI